MDPSSRTFTLICFSIFVVFSKPVTSSCQNCTKDSKEMVLIRPSHTDVKYFTLPTSDEPVVIWMDIQKGIYPNTSSIQEALQVGEPITIFIYLKDDSNLYDIMVTDCWAYDDQNFGKSKNKLHLTEEHSKSTKKNKIIDQWSRMKYFKESQLKCVLYSDLKSFKFPDKEQVFIKCDIQLCFKNCNKVTKKIT